MNIYKTKLFNHIVGDSLVDRTITLTMTRMTTDNIPVRNGMEEKFLIHFQETEKTLILNQVNARTIAKLYGAETEDWAGKGITLYTEEIRAFGKTHNAIRVAPAIPLSPTDEALEGFHAGENSVEDIAPKSDNPPPKKKGEEPLKFDGPGSAIAWAVEQGAYKSLALSQEAYGKVKGDKKPTSPKEMFDLWEAAVEKKLSLQQAPTSQEAYDTESEAPATETAQQPGLLDTNGAQPDESYYGAEAGNGQ